MNSRRTNAQTPAARHETDAEIVRLVLAGHRDDYAVLVHRYLRVVQTFLAGRFGLRGADLDDAVQSAFVTAYVQLSRLRDPARFAGYLLKIASRARGRFTGRRFVPLHSVDPAAAGTAPSGDDEPLAAAIARLPRKMQVVLALKYSEDLTAAEIAARIGQSVGSVTKTLSRAYKRLKRDRALRDWYGPPRD